MTDPTAPRQVSPRDIADLAAWATRLAHARSRVDPREQVAYLAAKADLLARIVDQLDQDHPHHAEQAHQAADHAATRAATRLAAAARAHRSRP
jgi:outer membrane murein-binding lipoprotein Lpp